MLEHHTPAKERTMAREQVTVRPNRYEPDGWAGPMFVVRRSGDDYLLTRDAADDEGQVWIHRQRIEER